MAALMFGRRLNLSVFVGLHMQLSRAHFVHLLHFVDELLKGGGWSRKGLNFEWPYFCQYLSELYQIFSSCVLCGYIIN